MTQHPEDGGDRDRKLDEDAAWRAIIENYGDRPPLGDEPPAATDSSDPPAEPGPPVVEPVETNRILEPGWRDHGQTEATWEDEGHFVPPDPPSPPLPEPKRRLAWLGLFGAPLVMLVAVVLGLGFPGWLMATLLACFVGGFVYLVATMPRGGGDGSNDNGAVV